MIPKKILILAITSTLLFSGVFAGAFIIYLYTPNIHLPTEPITMVVYDGTISYYDVFLSDVPIGFDVTNGLYIGWCSDRDVIMPRAEELTVRLYNSYDLLLPTKLRDEDWDKVNYIINHKGNATKDDIQEAIWHLINDYPYSEISDTAKNLVDTALDGFRPIPGELIAILAEPVYNEERSWPFQRAFIEILLPPQEGLTPGYWKNHDPWPENYTKTMPLHWIFSNATQYFPETDTLLDALKYQGGNDEQGMAEILLRAAVAAVLNARHPCINYPILEPVIIDEVNKALGSHDRDTMETLKNILDEFNNLTADLTH